MKKTVHFSIFFVTIFIIIGSYNTSMASDAGKHKIPESIIKKLYKKTIIYKTKTNSFTLIIPKKIKTSFIEPSEAELLDKYSPAKLIHIHTTSSKNTDIHLVSVKRMFFLPFGDYFLKWSKYKNLHMIIVSSGTFTLDKLCNLIQNPGIISKDSKGVFTLKAPLYIGWRASLTIKHKVVHLAVNPGAPIMCAGELNILNSVIKTWNVKTDKFDPIKIKRKENYYLYGAQPQRPYIVILRGGNLKIVSSTIQGLGYRGLLSSFGIGLSEWNIKKKMLLSPIIFIMYRPEGLNMSSVESKALLRLFTQKEKPSGIIVGNNIFDNYMGFYSNNAGKVVILGNIFRDNYQYNCDPHDWSKNMFIAYNIFEGAHKAHGVVFSRDSQGVVAKNISVGNHGAGIMMDRQSKALIKDNIVFANNIGGITLLESDNNTIQNNVIARNKAYGVYVRNSLNAQLNNNTFLRNVGSGAEISVMNISYQAYRNLYIDSYHEASSAWIEKNKFYNDLKCEIKSHLGAVGIYKNKFNISSYAPFTGSISRFTNKILSMQDKKPVIIYGKGNKQLIKKEVPDVKPYILKIEKRVLNSGNKEAELAIGLTDFAIAKVYNKAIVGIKLTRNELLESGLSWILRPAQRGNVNSLTALGLVLYLLTKENSNLYKEGIVVLTEAAMLGDMRALYILYLMPIMRGVKERVIQEAAEDAVKRIRLGKLIDYKIWNNANICKNQLANNNKILEKLSIFRKAMYISHSKSYAKFINIKAEHFSELAFLKKLKTVKERIRFNNERIKQFFLWQERQIKKAGKMYYVENNPNAIKFINKKLSILKTWQTILQNNKDKDFNTIKPLIIRRIIEINRFRDEKMKINEKNLLKKYRKKYFESE